MTFLSIILLVLSFVLPIGQISNPTFSKKAAFAVMGVLDALIAVGMCIAFFVTFYLGIAVGGFSSPMSIILLLFIMMIELVSLCLYALGSYYSYFAYFIPLPGEENVSGKEFVKPLDFIKLHKFDRANKKFYLGISIFISIFISIMCFLPWFNIPLADTFNSGVNNIVGMFTGDSNSNVSNIRSDYTLFQISDLANRIGQYVDSNALNITTIVSILIALIIFSSQGLFVYGILGKNPNDKRKSLTFISTALSISGGIIVLIAVLFINSKISEETYDIVTVTINAKATPYFIIILSIANKLLHNYILTKENQIV